MSKFLHGRVTYANVVATLALVFAMSGGALAANHYLINSTKQINPKVLKKLKGAKGKTGLPGISIQGPTGPPGPKGEKGTSSTGQPGVSAYEALPSGRSVSGEYAIQGKGMNGKSLEEAISFPIKVSGGISAEHEHIVYTMVGAEPVASHCSGPGHADKDYLCIYSAGLSTGLDAPTVMNPEVSPVSGEGTGQYGFLLSWQVTTEESVFDRGTYTVTAP
jgi:hypothetical protein